MGTIVRLTCDTHGHDLEMDASVVTLHVAGERGFFMTYPCGGTILGRPLAFESARLLAAARVRTLIIPEEMADPVRLAWTPLTQEYADHVHDLLQVEGAVIEEALEYE